MKWSHKVGRFADIDVRIHATFWLLLAWFGFTFFFAGGLPAAIRGVAFIGCLFFCVVLHEFGHALTARRFGIQTPDITLLPIGGVARMQRMPEKPLQEMLVALAGPAVNVLIALVLFLLFGLRHGIGEAIIWREPGAGAIPFTSRLIAVNVLLAVFNMIPAFPMDGGRVLRSLLAIFIPYGKATGIAASVGQTFAVLLGILGLLGFNPVLLLIAVFVYFGAGHEAAHARLLDLGKGVSAGDAMQTRLQTLEPTADLEEALELMLRSPQREIPVNGPGGAFRGIVLRDDLLAALKKGAGSSVADVMRADLQPIRADTSLKEAFEMLNTQATPVLPVVDAEERFAGLVTADTMAEYALLRSLRGKPTSRAADTTRGSEDAGA